MLMSRRDLGSEVGFLKFQRKKNLPEYSLVITTAPHVPFSQSLQHFEPLHKNPVVDVPMNYQLKHSTPVFLLTQWYI